MWKTLKEIEDATKNTPCPKLKKISVEDWDDLAQQKLEWEWWRREISEAYKELGGNPDCLRFRY